MKTKEEIQDLIKEYTKNNQYLFDMPPAPIQVNAPRALMQIAAIVKLETLYLVLGEERPKFIYDEKRS